MQSEIKTAKERSELIERKLFKVHRTFASLISAPDVTSTTE